MFDTLLIITLFLLASLPVCLLTLRLSINIKHFVSLFSFITDINGLFEIPPPTPLPFILDPPFIKFNKNLPTPSPVFFDPPPFIRHLRVTV